MRRGIVHVNPKYCSGCAICVEFCARQVLALAPDLNERAVHPVWVAQAERCTACRLCELYCPNFAISVEEVEEKVSA